MLLKYSLMVLAIRNEQAIVKVVVSYDDPLAQLSEDWLASRYVSGTQFVYKTF
ncbi:hypothetical protein KD050_18925 [Psychrobacillus sp. INOP01]|uniref:hypothetical protein n=1 Tax=Psychrobacillus sp. INOP01 TaxID=2829187 RepID=UPI001BA59B50|nr:hypothetical protein [Psychrobacillus sp. INOP01]QUG41324.1 hypothetical protein KD050_18925 [Psychrobacillus sp. INOP01]